MAYSILKPTIQNAFEQGEVLYFIDQTDFQSDIKHPELATFPDLTLKDGKDGRDDLKEGICAGLALHWLSLRYNGVDYPTQMVPLDEDPVPTKGHRKPPKARQVPFADARQRKAAENQLIVQRVAREADLFLSYLDAVMTSQYGIAVNRKAFRRHPGTVTGAYLKDEIERSGDGLYYVAMRRPDGGHAIGIEHYRNGFRLFDSNSASYQFSSSKRMFSFFQAYIDDFGYSGRCTAATWTGKIEPRTPLDLHMRHVRRSIYGSSKMDSLLHPGACPSVGPRPGRTPAYPGGL